MVSVFTTRQSKSVKISADVGFTLEILSWVLCATRKQFGFYISPHVVTIKCPTVRTRTKVTSGPSAHRRWHANSPLTPQSTWNSSSFFFFFPPVAHPVLLFLAFSSFPSMYFTLFPFCTPPVTLAAVNDYELIPFRPPVTTAFWLTLAAQHLKHLLRGIVSLLFLFLQFCSFTPPYNWALAIIRTNRKILGAWVAPRRWLKRCADMLRLDGGAEKEN